VAAWQLQCRPCAAAAPTLQHCNSHLATRLWTKRAGHRGGRQLLLLLLLRARLPPGGAAPAANLYIHAGAVFIIVQMPTTTVSPKESCLRCSKLLPDVCKGRGSALLFANRGAAFWTDGRLDDIGCFSRVMAYVCCCCPISFVRCSVIVPEDGPLLCGDDEASPHLFRYCWYRETCSFFILLVLWLMPPLGLFVTESTLLRADFIEFDYNPALPRQLHAFGMYWLWGFSIVIACLLCTGVSKSTKKCSCWPVRTPTVTPLQPATAVLDQLENNENNVISGIATQMALDNGFQEPCSCMAAMFCFLPCGVRTRSADVLSVMMKGPYEYFADNADRMALDTVEALLGGNERTCQYVCKWICLAPRWLWSDFAKPRFRTGCCWALIVLWSLLSTGIFVTRKVYIEHFAHEQTDSSQSSTVAFGHNVAWLDATFHFVLWGFFILMLMVVCCCGTNHAMDQTRCWPVRSEKGKPNKWCYKCRPEPSLNKAVNAVVQAREHAKPGEEGRETIKAIGKAFIREAKGSLQGPRRPESPQPPLEEPLMQGVASAAVDAVESSPAGMQVVTKLEKFANVTGADKLVHKVTGGKRFIRKPSDEDNKAGGDGGQKKSRFKKFGRKSS
jgi:hypothetical protein